MEKVTIFIKGGVAEIIEKTKNVDLEIRDYDLEGGCVDEEIIKTDADGNKYWQVY